MIIRKLTLHNFGIYAGDNIFELNNDKPVVLIGGLNGRGKTTFLEAILIALYGSNSFAFTDSQYNNYGAYLRAHVNTIEGASECFVELVFDMNEENDMNTYVVRRSWSTEKKRIKDKVDVYKNDFHDEFLSKNWNMFIESVLPSALSSFFFFDGEKIAEIAENDTSIQMKESIKALLGINIIDMLENDLNRIINRISAEQKEDANIQRIEELRVARDSKEKELNDIDKEIEELKFELEKLNKRLNNKENDFRSKGGDIAGESQKLYDERNQIEGKLNQIQERMIEIAASDYPLLLVKPLLDRIEKQASKEMDNRTMKITLDRIHSLLEDYGAETNGDNNNLSNFLDYVNAKTESLIISDVFSLSDHAWMQLTALVSMTLVKSRNSYKEYINQQKALLARKNQIENYLAVEIDEFAIQKLYQQITKIKLERIEIEENLLALEKKRKTINGEFIKANTSFNRFVEESLSSLERSDDNKRMLAYAILAARTAQRYKIALQQEKIHDLAEVMTTCYKKLLGKKNLIDRIEMNPKTLDYYYIDKIGRIVSKKSLSAGEKQLMVIAMLWALAICSKRKLPVIIDTPMARLDSYHRTALIERYFPFASKQTIILSTDSEIDSEYYKMIRKNVSNEFTLVYDEETKCSHVEMGYFKDVI